jgi:hypothetical protein
MNRHPIHPSPAPGRVGVPEGASLEKLLRELQQRVGRLERGGALRGTVAVGEIRIGDVLITGEENEDGTVSLVATLPADIGNPASVVLARLSPND